MLIERECQALCVAVEMEKRAIRIYERALMLVQDADVRRAMEEILADEQMHLCRFQAMQVCHPVGKDEEKLLISSLAAEVLFPGGVMEMARQQALADLSALYRYAAQSEADAVATYGQFAARCQDESVREAFMSIVREESYHLSVLQEKLNQAQ